VTCEHDQFFASCPPRQVITQITSASYGRNDTSICDDPAIYDTNCAADPDLIMGIIQDACLNMASCTIDVENTHMGGDPCGGTYKFLAVSYTCGHASPPPPPELPPLAPPRPPSTPPSPSLFLAVSGYSITINQGVLGSDISVNVVTSPGQCAEICNANASCVGFNYIVSTPDIPLCIPKSSFRGRTLTDSYNALYKREANLGSVTAIVCEGTQFSACCPAGQNITQIVNASYGRSDTATCMHADMYDTSCAANGILSIVQGACLHKSSCTIDINNPNMGGDPCGGTYKYLKVTYVCAHLPTSTPLAPTFKL
jgi:hypothetical protein